MDGSVSYSIDTSNLNYLLNGQSPIYFLWLAPTNEIRYAWAKDEWRRLDAEKPDWMKQGTFTIRFRNVLDTAAINAIYDRIVKEARFVRTINEILARASLSEGVVVRIDPQTLESTDPLKLYGWITSSGMTIVSSGYGAKILEWFGVLNLEHRGDPRVNLVVAYAQVSLGRNYQALGSLAEAKLGIGKLSPDDRDFLGYLEDVLRVSDGTDRPGGIPPPRGRAVRQQDRRRRRGPPAGGTPAGEAALAGSRPPRRVVRADAFDRDRG